MGKTIGTWWFHRVLCWFYGISWDLPSGVFWAFATEHGGWRSWIYLLNRTRSVGPFVSSTIKWKPVKQAPAKSWPTSHASVIPNRDFTEAKWGVTECQKTGRTIPMTWFGFSPHVCWLYNTFIVSLLLKQSTKTTNHDHIACNIWIYMVSPVYPPEILWQIQTRQPLDSTTFMGL